MTGMTGADISVFLPSLAGGGAERVMLNLAGKMAERGLRVDLVLCQTSGAFLEQVPAEVRVISLGASRVSFSLLKLVRYLRATQPKALLSAMDHTNVIAILAARIAMVGTRVVVSVHTALTEASLLGLPFRRRWLIRLMRLTYPRADNVVAVSEGVASDLVSRFQLGHRDVTVVYNPIVSAELGTLASLPLEHPWFAVGEPPVVLGVGRLIDSKDFGTLIRAVALLRRQRNVRLVILGEGEERLRLETLVHDLGMDLDVDMPGFVGNPYRFMRRAAVVALSSRHEGLPTVLVEAIACGTPVVSCDCPWGPAEVLEAGNIGRLTAVGDPQELSAALGDTLDKPPDRARLLARASNFTIDESVARYLKLLMPGEAH